jgi:hypothetical protein
MQAKYNHSVNNGDGFPYSEDRVACKEQGKGDEMACARKLYLSASLGGKSRERRGNLKEGQI